MQPDGPELVQFPLLSVGPDDLVNERALLLGRSATASFLTKSLIKPLQLLIHALQPVTDFGLRAPGDLAVDINGPSPQPLPPALVLVVQRNYALRQFLCDRIMQCHVPLVRSGADPRLCEQLLPGIGGAANVVRQLIRSE